MFLQKGVVTEYSCDDSAASEPDLRVFEYKYFKKAQYCPDIVINRELTTVFRISHERRPINLHARSLRHRYNSWREKSSPIASSFRGLKTRPLKTRSDRGV